jgi:hypothetical protein
MIQVVFVGQEPLADGDFRLFRRSFESTDH